MTYLKRMIMYTIMLMFAMVVANSDIVYATSSSDKKIKSIAWEDYGKTLTIEKGEKLKLGVVYTPKKKINKKLKWKSSKKKVVSVSSKGVITGKKKGKATITATTTDGSNKKLKLKVTVGVKVGSIEFTNTTNGKMDKIYTGKTYTVNTSIKPSNASNKSIIWKSSDPDIAKVDSKGVITPLANGLVMISAEASDGSGVVTEEEFEVGTLVSSFTLSCKEDSPYELPIGSSGACVKG